MTDILIFVFGIAVGAGGLYALFALHRWADSLFSKINLLKWELERYSMERELWAEFLIWKNEQKSKSE